MACLLYTSYIPEEKAARFRENPTGGNGEWAQTPENGRWWYRNADGSYPANSWQQIGGKWYFFDAQGYMVTGWVQSVSYTHLDVYKRQSLAG